MVVSLQDKFAVHNKGTAPLSLLSPVYVAFLRQSAKAPPSRKHCRSRGINKIYDVIHFGYESDLISSRRPDRTDCDNAIEWKEGKEGLRSSERQG